MSLVQVASDNGEAAIFDERQSEENIVDYRASGSLRMRFESSLSCDLTPAVSEREIEYFDII